MRRGALLERLGVFGFSPIEDAVLAAVSLGEPLLLVGNPGTAKTALAMALGRALGMKTWAYDAAKAMFEDIVGFPSPASLVAGRVEYVPTPMSLWAKEMILVDELSRAAPSTQSRWLEVVRSRRLMGIPLPRLRVVVGAMNPPGLAGTLALDPALAGRFTYVVEVPEVHEMTDRERDAIIRLRGPDDGPAMGATPTDLPDLAPLAADIRARYPTVESSHGGKVRRYVERVREFLAERNHRLDGRRLGMMYRGLMGLAAARGALGYPGGRGIASLASCLRHGLECTLPGPASGDDPGRLLLEAAHGHAVQGVLGQGRPLVPVHDPLAGVKAMAQGHPGFDDPDRASVLVTRLVAGVEDPGDDERAARAGAALLLLAGNALSLARLPVEARHRVMSCFLEATSIDGGRLGEGSPDLADPDSGFGPATREALRRVARHVSLSLGPRQMGIVDSGPVAERMALLLAREGIR